MINDIRTLVFKDLKLDARRAENFFSMLFFSITILLIFAFALPQKQATQIDILSGVFWIAFLLSGLLSLNKAFQLEKENGCIEAILVSPVSRGAIFLGKMLGTVIFILIVQGLVIPIFGILFHSVVFSHFASILFLGFLAAIGFASLGTLLAGLTTDIRFREILLPILLFPLVVPLLLACVKITQSLLAGEGFVGAGDWLRLLVGFDLIFLIVSFLTFEFVMEL
jgi:heme exporter protein B